MNNLFILNMYNIIYLFNITKMYIFSSKFKKKAFLGHKQYKLIIGTAAFLLFILLIIISKVKEISKTKTKIALCTIAKKENRYINILLNFIKN